VNEQDEFWLGGECQRQAKIPLREMNDLGYHLKKSISLLLERKYFV